MKTLILEETAPLKLAERETPRPKAGPGEVVVQVYAAAVTPSELLWFPTLHTRDGGNRNAPVLGHEFAGKVVECGVGVDDFTAGQDVYGMNDWFAEGALAEYCVTTPEWIAHMPRGLTHEQAATVPISALTAWQGLFERGRLTAGERVLVHGGSGAVGMFAVQLAKLHGASVVATVSAANMDFVKAIGADEALDYRGVPFDRQLRDIDLVFDTVGGETLRRSWGVLKPGGRVVTVAAESESETDDRIRQAFFIVEPNRAQLTEITKLLEAGKLQAVVSEVRPVSGAAEAYGGFAARRGRGKVVISTRPWSTSQPAS